MSLNIHSCVGPAFNRFMIIIFTIITFSQASTNCLVVRFLFVDFKIISMNLSLKNISRKSSTFLFGAPITFSAAGINHGRIWNF